MIRYSLKCATGHDFEAWFRSSAAFDEQREAGRVACAVCGSVEVAKAPMAPALKAGRAAAGPSRPASRGSSQAGEAALGALRRHIERTSDYVGPEFASEARRIHTGEAEKRSIWGEASRDEARSLKDEGIPVAPIPWMRRSDG
ncbi:MAG TPA: DUF1178 family protein [Thermohalobaculum sp.]|nr:DUF1178 family protein [Thermohalobaculum sp.]